MKKRTIFVILDLLAISAAIILAVTLMLLKSPKRQYERGLKHLESALVSLQADRAQLIGQGVKLLESAADKNYAPAQFSLGMLYLFDDYEMKDPQKAAEWLLRSAEQGHRDACHNLGKMFYEGAGVARNVPAAIRWMTTAASMGEIEDVLILALLYIDGDEGVPADLEEAYKWFTVADLMGFSTSEPPFGRFQKETAKISQAAQIRAKAKAAEFFRQIRPPQFRNE